MEEQKQKEAFPDNLTINERRAALGLAPIQDDNADKVFVPVFVPYSVIKNADGLERSEPSSL